jgi:hypothetical protein
MGSESRLNQIFMSMGGRRAMQIHNPISVQITSDGALGDWIEEAGFISSDFMTMSATKTRSRRAGPALQVLRYQMSCFVNPVTIEILVSY